MKILIIEDDLELREELKVLLDNNGYQGIILKDFKNALEEILVIDPDLILLDIKIPFLNGQQLIKKIKRKIKLFQLLWLQVKIVRSMKFLH